MANNNGYKWTSLDQFYNDIYNVLRERINIGDKYEGVVITGSLERFKLENLRKGLKNRLNRDNIDLPVFTFSSEKEANNLQYYRLNSGKPGYHKIDFDWFIENSFKKEAIEQILSQLS